MKKGLIAERSQLTEQAQFLESRVGMSTCIKFNLASYWPLLSQSQCLYNKLEINLDSN